MRARAVALQLKVKSRRLRAIFRLWSAHAEVIRSVSDAVLAFIKKRLLRSSMRAWSLALMVSQKHRTERAASDWALVRHCECYLQMRMYI